MRIAFVSQWFPPEPGTFVGASIVDGLAARGHHIDVLTGFPNYPTGRLHKDYPLKYYRREHRSQRVTVHRFPLYPSHNAHALPRAINYLSFAASSSWISRGRIPKPDVWLVYSSPATSALPALLAPKSRRAPICLLIMDLWPDSVTDSGFMDNGAQRHLRRGVELGLTKLCQWSYSRASAIGITSPGMRPILVERGVPSRKIHSSPNHIDDRSMRTIAEKTTRDELGLPQGRLFLYAGNVGSLQGLQNLVSAFALVPEAKLVIAGNGVERHRLQNQAEATAATNITFIDSQPTDRIGAYLAAADVHIVSLKDSPLMRVTMPSKAQVAMALGKPILAHIAGDTARLVAENRIGAVADPTNLNATVAAINDLMALGSSELTLAGQRSRELYESNYSSTVGIDRLESMLTQSLDESQ